MTELGSVSTFYDCDYSLAGTFPPPGLFSTPWHIRNGGGACACSTCHVIVKEGLETCNDPTDDENDQLDEAPDLSLKSRLACQCVPNGEKDLIIEVPEWHKNLVKESY